MKRDVCAILLAGGRGTRIAHLRPGIPKPFIEAAGAPFIHWVLTHLRDQGLSRAVVSLGHLARVGRRILAQRTIAGLEIESVVEREALGTAGAMLLAADCVRSADPILLLNGDSLLLADYAPIWELLSDESLDGVMLGIPMSDAARYGRLRIDANGLLTAFDEKAPGAGLVNAGVYVLRRRLLAGAPRGPALSMETQFLPALLRDGARIQVLAMNAPFIDIGTPETLDEATAFIERHFCQGAAA